MEYVVRPSTISGSPAFGFIISGRLVHFRSSSTIGSISTGPTEQFIPSAVTPSPSSVSAMAESEQPVKVLWSFSKLIVQKTGKSVCSLAASTAAFASFKSVIVSMKTASAPAAAPASICSANSAYAVSNDSVPIGASSSPSGPISSPTNAPYGSAAFLAHRTPACTACSTVRPVPCSLCAFAPKVLLNTT